MTVGFEFCYSEKIFMTCHAPDGREVTKYSDGFMTMDKALETANVLIEDMGFNEVTCCNANTGEVIFIARAHPDECVEEVDDTWEDDWYEFGWNCNEDMGFDPYMGCYTDDC